MSNSKLLYLMMMMAGVLMAVSADSWFIAWCGLELNLLSFIPFVCEGANMYATEAMVKYFLVQALGSVCVILCGVSLSVPIFSQYLKWVVALSLLLKMGMAPVHFWMPSVMSGMSWVDCYLLMSVQKFAPLVLLAEIMDNSLFGGVFMLVVFFGILVGSFGGLNQVYLRNLVAYSSINHLSWIIVGLLSGNFMWLTYFFYYIVISGSVIFLFFVYQLYHICDLYSMGYFSSVFIVSVFSMLSLAGLPPFSGFVPKWLIIQELVDNFEFLILVFLVNGTLVTLYYYLRLTLVGLTLSSSKPSYTKKNEQLIYKSNMTIFVYFMLMGLWFVPIVVCIVHY